MSAPSTSGPLRITATLVGIAGLVLVILAAISGYQAGVEADEQGTVGQISAIQIGGVLIGVALIALAIIQLALLHSPRKKA